MTDLIKRLKRNQK